MSKRWQGEDAVELLTSKCADLFKRWVCKDAIKAVIRDAMIAERQRWIAECERQAAGWPEGARGGDQYGVGRRHGAESIRHEVLKT